MTSVLYAILSSIWICWLVLQVVKARRKHKIAYGDGENVELQIAKSAHGNAVETIPIMLILLFALEINQAALWLVHLLGISLLIARLIHGRGLLSQQLKLRVLGMQLTIFVIIFLIVANLVYYPYGKLL